MIDFTSHINFDLTQRSYMPRRGSLLNTAGSPANVTTAFGATSIPECVRKLAGDGLGWLAHPVPFMPEEGSGENGRMMMVVAAENAICDFSAAAGLIRVEWDSSFDNDRLPCKTLTAFWPSI